MERRSFSRIRRSCAGALALGLSFAGVALVSPAAHAATSTATYVSEADGVTTNEVDATVIGTQTSSLSSGWYLCDDVLDTTNFVTASGAVDLILGDSCDWRIDALSSPGTGSITVWSGIANTGKLTATASSTAGIRVYDGASLTLRGGAVTAYGAAGSAGIGQGVASANGAITIEWRANVFAVGGDAGSSYGAGAGIGGGGSYDSTSFGGQNISINTSGLVIARGGNARGPLTAGANIGSGGGNGVTAVQSQPTITVNQPNYSPSGFGTSLMFDTKLQTTSSAVINNVARGSAVTYLAQAVPGFQVSNVASPDGTVTSLGNNLFRFAPRSPGPAGQQVTAYFSFAPIPTALSLTVSPSSPQTFPGNVTLSSTFTDAGYPIENIPVVFTVNGTAQSAVPTNNEGVATLSLSSPNPGSYSFGASFAGDSSHAAATATKINDYVVLALQPDFAINAPDPVQTAYGHAPFLLGTKGHLSSADVTWSVPANNGVVSLNQTTGEVTILAAGTVTVTATAPADSSHAVATATRSVTISLRPVTVRPKSQSIQFGEDFDLTWIETPALIEGDSLTGSLKLADAMLIGDNEIVEDVPFANPNYSVYFEAGTLTVTANEAQQTVIDEITLLPSPISTRGQADSVAVATQALNDLSFEERAVLPQLIVDNLNAAQLEAGLVNHSETDAGITATSEVLPWNVRLIVRAASAQETASFSGQIEANRDLLSLNDIHFFDTLRNETWQPPLGSTVEIALSKVQLRGFDDIQVHHQLVSGDLETVPSSIDGTVVSFNGSSFSLYGVSGVKVPALPSTGAMEITAGIRFAGLAILLAGATAFVVLATRKHTVHL